MSPTYWTASRIKMAARAHGWTFIPCDPPGYGPWGMSKEIHHHSPAGHRYDYTEHLRIMLQENRRGGLVWVKLTRAVPGASDTVYLGPRTKDKLAVILSWLSEPVDWKTPGVCRSGILTKHSLEKL